MTVYDVIVSGAGPAGSYSAYMLAKRGYSVVLLEKSSFPRIKTCAGGILPRASNSLEFTIPQNIIQKEIKGVSIIKGDYHKEFRFDNRISVTVIRSEFDDFLMDQASQAGANVAEKEEVTGVDQSGSTVEVKTSLQSYKARTLVIAEGAASRTATKVLGPRASPLMALGLSEDVGSEIDSGDLFEVYLLDVPTRKLDWGCPLPLMGWMFPKRSGCNIGVGGVGYSKAAMIGGARTVFEACKKKYGVETDEQNMSARPIPISPRRTLHKGRILAIGDAAGFASPISGEGMSYAFQSARFAVDAIESQLGTDPGKDPFALYDRQCRNHIMRDMRAASLIAPPLHWILGVIDVEKFISRMDQSQEVLNSCRSIALGETDWRTLLIVGIRKFPELFFSSLS